MKMERKPDCTQQEEQKDEAERVLHSSRFTINGDIDGISEEGLSVLKREISCHSLYGFLVQSHLECLKLCLGNTDSIDFLLPETRNPLDTMQNGSCSRFLYENYEFGNNPDISRADKTELDQFMEAYCMTLKKVKEVMKEPQEESMAFIEYMYSQLEQLVLEIPSSSTLSAINTSRGTES